MKRFIKHRGRSIVTGKWLYAEVGDVEIIGPKIYINDRSCNVASIDFESLEHLRFPTRCEVRGILARHICDLLNREHYKKGGKR